MKVLKIISWLVLVASAVVLVATKSWPNYKSFLAGAPIFVVQDATGAPGSSLGTLPVQKGKYYALNVRSDAVAPFTLFLTYQNGDKSKVLIDDPRYPGPAAERLSMALAAAASAEKPYESVVRADRTDPAAQLTIGRVARPPWATNIKFSRVSISELNPRFYLWRTLARHGSVFALLAAFLSLAAIWRRERFIRPSRSPSELEDAVKPPWSTPIWRIARAGKWAAMLLIIGTFFDAYYLGYDHSSLLTKTFHSSITGWDGSFYYFWLRSVMVDGDIDFSNDLLYCNTMPPSYRREIVATTPRTKTGLIPDKYPIGWALLGVPWYIAADLTAQFTNWCGGHTPYDGFDRIYQVFLVFGQVVYATASLYFSCKILMEYLPPAFAGCGLILGWMGSPLFFYQTIDVIMAHNVMFFAMTGAYYYTYRLRRRPEELRLWFLVGLLSAFVILARYQGAIMLLFPGIVCLQEVLKNYRHASGLIVAVVAGAIPLSLQMIAWKIMYGSFFLYTYQGETFNWAHPHLWEVLFSPFHGLFNWHPMMLIGFLGFLAWAVQSRRYTEAVCFTVSLLLSIYVNASWNNWWFGGSFGSRAFETCTLFSMLGVGFLLSLLVRRAVVFHTAAFALLVLAVWNMNMMYLSENGLLPFEKPETWKQRLIMTDQYWSHAFDWPEKS